MGLLNYDKLFPKMFEKDNEIYFWAFATYVFINTLVNEEPEYY